MIFEAPRPISPGDDFCSFSCGRDDLDKWLKTRALKNEGMASRTYVLCVDRRVAGFYSLAVGSVSHELVPGSIRRNMPEPIPVMLLARLGIDVNFQGRAIGAGLLRDALLRTAQAASIAGIRAVMVNAVDDQAASFYRHFGFRESPVNRLLLLLSMREIQNRLGR